MPKKGTNIYKRKDGRWEARYVSAVKPDGTKKYASVYAASYREARDKQLLCMQNVHPVTTGSTNMLLEELMWNWLNSTENKVKRSTYLKYESMISNHLTTGLGQIPVKLLTGNMVDQFTNEKLHGTNALSPKSTDDLLVILGLAFSYAEQEYGLSQPALRRVKETPKQMRVLSIEEQRILESYLLTDMDSYKLGVLLALYTGLRVGELCALQWSDIKDGNITVNKSLHRIKKGIATVLETTSPKTPASNRTIPLPAFLLPILERHRSVGPVICTPRGTQAEPRLMQQKFEKYIAACNLHKANFHALRHTFATRCVEAGFDVKTLSEILGHTDVKTTLNRYVHYSYALKQINMEKLKPFALL
jgi:integrase